jgi:hypothetical protein
MICFGGRYMSSGELKNGKKKKSDSKDSSKDLQNSISEMKEGSKTFSKLRQFAKELSKSLEEPIASMNLLNEMRHVRVGPAFAIGTNAQTERSPARTLDEYYQLVQRSKDEDRTLEEITGKSNQEMREELEEAVESNIESEFNFLGYRFLYELENFLRDLIQERIVIPNENNIGNYVPKNILEQCNQRKSTEESSAYIYGSYRWIDYSDFNDLKTILEKGKNHRYFQDVLNEEQFKCVVSKLHELDPIRKKIAHSRSLTKEEFNRLSMYSEDIDILFRENSQAIAFP